MSYAILYCGVLYSTIVGLYCIVRYAQYSFVACGRQCGHSLDEGVQLLLFLVGGLGEEHFTIAYCTVILV